MAGKEINTVREDIERLCHKIYDVLPISPAMKLLDDGKLYALISSHDEAIRRECADKAIDYINKTYESINRDAIRASTLGAEPTQDDGKPEVGDIVAWDKEGLNVEAYKHPRREIVRRPVVLMRFAEVKRRLEEAKE